MTGIWSEINSRSTCVSSLSKTVVSDVGIQFWLQNSHAVNIKVMKWCSRVSRHETLIQTAQMTVISFTASTCGQLILLQLSCDGTYYKKRSTEYTHNHCITQGCLYFFFSFFFAKIIVKTCRHIFRFNSIQPNANYDYKLLIFFKYNSFFWLCVPL